MFPGCDCDKHLDAHHIVHWSNDGETSLENLIEVCHHHHVLLHEGGYSVHRTKTGELHFFKPDGSRLSSTPMQSSCDSPLQISAKSAWHSNGDSMDYGVATHCIGASTKSKKEMEPA